MQPPLAICPPAWYNGSDTEERQDPTVTRQEFETHIQESYGILPDYPFDGDGTTAVFRHRMSRKWFAILMKIPASKLGLPDGGSLDVVNLKCAPEMLPSLWQEAGIFPAYHMNKRHWITAVLDGRTPDELLACLVGVSFDLTGSKK